LEDWLSKALESFPELQDEIFQNRDYSNPSDLWIDLFAMVCMAYDEQPVNEDLIGRIYDYAAWCFKQPDTGDARTDLPLVTELCLIENIPLKRNVSADLYRWMSAESFNSFETTFRYDLDTEGAYRKFHDEFMEKKKGYSGFSRI